MEKVTTGGNMRSAFDGFHSTKSAVEDPTSNLTVATNSAATSKLNYGKPTVDKTVVVVRILSNDLPPLHGEQQTYLNTETILKHEQLPPGFKRLWMLSGMVDETKQGELFKLLHSHNEWYFVITISETNNVQELEEAALNVNKARNAGLKLGFDSGAYWVIVFDGCSFITRESYHSIWDTLAKITTNIFYYVPMVRLYHRIEINADLTYRDLFNVTSGLQECQIAVSRKYLELRNRYSFYRNQHGLLFNEALPYAEANKLRLLEDTRRRFPKDVVYCKEAYVGTGRQKSPYSSLDDPLIKKCGYIVRLLYHPRAVNETDFQLSDLQRFRRRNLAKKRFKLELKKRADMFK